MAAVRLRALLLESATPEERKTIEDGLAEGPGPDLFLPGPVESEGYRRTLRRAAADTTFATILVRILAQRRWSATARDENSRLGEFDLEELRDSVQFVNWATSTLDAPSRGYRGPLYRASIEVEVDSGEEQFGEPPQSVRLREPTREEREAMIRKLAEEHPEAGQEALYKLHQHKNPTVKIPRRLFPKKPGGRPPRG